MIRSLRFRLLAATSIATMALLALFGTSIYLAMRHQLLADFDASLLAKAKMLSNSVEQHGTRIHPEFEANDLAELSAGRHPQYFQLRANGTVIASSKSLEQVDLPADALDAKARAGNILLPDNALGRAAVLSFSPSQGEEDEDRPRAAAQTCTLTVAGTPYEAQRTLDYLGWLLIGACLAATGISGAVLLVVVSRGIRPVNALARDVDAAQESDLSFRLQQGGVPAELHPIIDKLNGLFARIEQAFAREKALTADVAHELRTPLAGLITTLEVCRSRQRSVADYEGAIDECLAMIDRMQKMVENLLLLSRTEAGHLEAKSQDVVLNELLTDTWTLFHHRAKAKQVNLQWSLADDSIAKSDATFLQIVFQNLLDNAVSYVNPGGEIGIQTRCEHGLVEVQIANSGSEIKPSDVPKIFDRFWRADSSRSDTGIHCGLGMSLTQRLIGLLGGGLTVDCVYGGKFSVTVSLATAQQKGHATPILSTSRGQ